MSCHIDWPSGVVVLKRLCSTCSVVGVRGHGQLEQDTTLDGDAGGSELLEKRCLVCCWPGKACLRQRTESFKQKVWRRGAALWWISHGRPWRRQRMNDAVVRTRPKLSPKSQWQKILLQRWKQRSAVQCCSEEKCPAWQCEMDLHCKMAHASCLCATLTTPRLLTLVSRTERATPATLSGGLAEDP